MFFNLITWGSSMLRVQKTWQCSKSGRPTRVLASCVELKPRPFCDWRLVWRLVVSLYSAHDVWLAAHVTCCPCTQLYMVGSAFQALLLSCSLQESIKHASSRRRDSIFIYAWQWLLLLLRIQLLCVPLLPGMYRQRCFSTRDWLPTSLLRHRNWHDAFIAVRVLCWDNEMF